MKRLICASTILLALVVSGTALAGPSAYGGPRYWLPNEGAGSSFSSSWTYNAFNKQSSGFDTTVTFIDNVSYGWHETIRNTSMVTYTRWWSSQTKKAHCRANQGYFNGGCWVD